MNQPGQHGASDAPHTARPGVTLRTLGRMASAGEPFACLTCYDATTASWLESAGVHVLLVGDTAAEVVLGHASTVHMPLDVALALTAGVKRGAPNTVVMGDMPFGSYQADDAEAVRNAARFMTEGLADVVKFEGDERFASTAERMARAGIPLCGHVGCKPQSAALTGGYASRGKTAADAAQIVADAVALEQAGCVMLLVEAVPPEVTDAILASTSVPLIGIGAGPAPHGQILVLHDLIGMTRWQPGFAQPVAGIGSAIADAVAGWVGAVADRRSSEHRYRMKQGEPGELAGAVRERLNRSAGVSAREKP